MMPQTAGSGLVKITKGRSVTSDKEKVNSKNRAGKTNGAANAETGGITTPAHTPNANISGTVTSGTLLNIFGIS